MIIKTKIVATLGPASRELPVLSRLVKSGADVFRINFSHGSLPEHLAALKNVRAASAKAKEPLGVMADLCGPKIRVGKMTGGGVLLPDGAELIIQREEMVGTARRISTTLAELVDDVRRGHRLCLDDGKLLLEVVEVDPPKQVRCRVIHGGMLGSGKGVNLPDTDLSLAALTEKDRSDAKWIAKHDFDYVALSFVRKADDVDELRQLLEAEGSDAKIIAKIEKPQALKNIDAIIEAADGILVARGDMGVEMPLPEVPLTQKRLVRLCQQARKPCIIATQMLESMTENPGPTRAEVSDVANAVLDGADAVMLSGETAVGKYPARAVAMMNNIVSRTEEYQEEFSQPREMLHKDVAAGWAMAQAVQTMVASSEDIKAVVTHTASGGSAKVLAKARLNVPILALTANKRVMQQCCLLYGVYSFQTPTPKHTREVLSIASRVVRQLKWARKGEKVIVLSGRPLGKAGSTNTLVVHTV